MTYGTARTATRTAKAATVILTAVSCSVYDASLLGNGSAGAGSGGAAAGLSGTAGDETSGAGHSGSAGAAVNGGSSGSGEGGMMDTAGEAGSDNSEGGTAGSGGAGAAAGTDGGTAGAAVAGSGGIVGGGTGGGGGSGGSPPASGCAKLYVPIDASTDTAHFVISLASAIDLSNATYGTVSMHVYVQAGAAGTLFNYVQDSQYHYFGVTTASRPALKGLAGWQTLSFPVGAQAVGSTSIVKTDIRRIGIEINALPDTTGWSNPTVVYVDSVTVSTTATATPLSFPLDTMATVNPTPMTTDAAAQVMWLNSGSSDTTATGVTLAWQATCP